jgi:hypothetical protein
MPRENAMYKRNIRLHMGSLKLVRISWLHAMTLLFLGARLCGAEAKKLELRYLVLVYHEYLKDHEEN